MLLRRPLTGGKPRRRRRRLNRQTRPPPTRKRRATCSLATSRARIDYWQLLRLLRVVSATAPREHYTRRSADPRSLVCHWHCGKPPNKRSGRNRAARARNYIVAGGCLKWKSFDEPRGGAGAELSRRPRASSAVVRAVESPPPPFGRQRPPTAARDTRRARRREKPLARGARHLANSKAKICPKSNQAEQPLTWSVLCFAAARPPPWGHLQASAAGASAATSSLRSQSYRPKQINTN